MLRLPIWTAALPAIVFVAGCAETMSSQPNSAEVAHACAGIPEAQARSFPVDLRADVERVETVREPTKTKPFVVHTVGADVYVRATPGMTAQWLTRLTQCHLTHEARGTSGDANCPLAVPETTIDVFPTTGGFVVSIRSSDFVAAQEIARRAKLVFGTASERTCQNAGWIAPITDERRFSL